MILLKDLFFFLYWSILEEMKVQAHECDVTNKMCKLTN